MGDLWKVKKAWYRTYQAVLGVAVKCMKFPRQVMLTGEGKLADTARVLKGNGIDNVLIVCSRSVHKHGLMDKMLEGFAEEEIQYTIFEDIHPNPTIANVEAGLELYKENGCKGIVTIGGGSPMDCAKIIGLRYTNPHLSYHGMKNMLRISHRMPFMIAVPTTAGTGSESTAAAVIANPDKHEKYAVVSPYLMPDYVILDPALTVGLPATVTAYTGMDALTHAIEAYIGRIDTRYTDKEALEAIKLTLEYLPKAYHTPDDLVAREKMLIASNKAGNAFTRVYIGYVHSFSHAMSALYDVGHGKTNAIILPNMLTFYGSSIYKKMGRIARYVNIGKPGDSDEQLTRLLISRIEQLNVEFDIPNYVEEIRPEDVSTIVFKALKEGNPGYPVPYIMNAEQGRVIVEDLIKRQR